MEYFLNCGIMCKPPVTYPFSATELDTLIEHTRYYVLLSRVYHKQERLDDSMLHLTKAHDLQGRVLKRVQVEQPDAVTAQKVLAARYA